MTTLKDIAKITGLSVSTVSKALNQNPHINEKTREKIMKIADELNYNPNFRAQALAKKSNNIIGVVIPRLDRFYYSELTHYIKKNLQKIGYNIILCSTDKKAEEEKKFIINFGRGQVDGAIFTELHKSNKKLLINLAKKIPVVGADTILGDIVNSNNNIPIVGCDLKKAASKLTKYLIELGHKKIIYVGSCYQRLEGYKKVMERYNYLVGKNFYMDTYDTYTKGITVGKKILELSPLPTAIICMNDELAIGVIHSLKVGGVKVPEDISVCGIDNIEISQSFTPAITSVNIPKKKIAKKVVDLLSSHLSCDNFNNEMNPFVYPFELLKRESTISIE